MSSARGYFEIFLGWFCLPFREVGNGRGSGSSAAYASHSARRDAGGLLCFLVNSICGPFSKGQQNPEGRRGAGWQALANGAAMLALGYPAEAHASRLRKKLEEIVAYDGWRIWPPGVPVSFKGDPV